MTITRSTLNKLFTLSRNICAFPRCENPILDTEHNVLTGEICHIKGKNPKGPRYDASQTPEERDGFDNLLLMCGAHNKIVDDPLTQAAFTVEMLTGYKRHHEAQSENTVIKKDVLEHFAQLLILQSQLTTNLSDDALRLLKETAKDPHGRLLRIGTFGGLFIQTNGHQFVEQQTPREEARWEAVVNELELQGLLQPLSYERQVFQITDEGYRIADSND